MPTGQYWVFKKKKKNKIEAQYSCTYFARKWALASELKKKNNNYIKEFTAGNL